MIKLIWQGLQKKKTYESDMATMLLTQNLKDQSHDANRQLRETLETVTLRNSPENIPYNKQLPSLLLNIRL